MVQVVTPNWFRLEAFYRWKPLTVSLHWVTFRFVVTSWRCHLSVFQVSKGACKWSPATKQEHWENTFFSNSQISSDSHSRAFAIWNVNSVLNLNLWSLWLPCCIRNIVVFWWFLSRFLDGCVNCMDSWGPQMCDTVPIWLHQFCVNVFAFQSVVVVFVVSCAVVSVQLTPMHWWWHLLQTPAKLNLLGDIVAHMGRNNSFLPFVETK